MTIAREEIFGPVLAVIPFRDVEEAVRIGQRHRVRPRRRRLDAATWARPTAWPTPCAPGTVWVNMYHALDIGVPFGGYKQSGYGRELGRYALDLYTQVKSVWVNLE